MMENAQLIGLSRQMALRRQMDVVANNLANMQTSGFKAASIVFEEYQMATAEMEAASRGDAIVSYVVDRASFRDFGAGAMRQTGAPLDVAIGGDGFFTVQTPDGLRYTRDGSFKMDAEGQLVTASGHPVLGEAGPITFDPEDTGIVIGRDGTVATSAGEKGRLRISAFDDVEMLEAEGGNLFADGGAAAVAAQDPRVMQGMLEGSNVAAVAEMTNMIEVNRAYQSFARMVEQTDELRRSTITTLSRVS